MLVVKVGGSLYDLPDLGPRLRGFLASLKDVDRLIVPGGGATTDAIRLFDRDHGLGPEQSHWLALCAAPSTPISSLGCSTALRSCRHRRIAEVSPFSTLSRS